jgi:hypothetical protein
MCKPLDLENGGLGCVCDVEEVSREGEDETDEEIDKGLGKSCDCDDEERENGGGLRSVVIISGEWCNANSSSPSESPSQRTVLVSRSSSELVKGSGSAGRLP